MTRGSVGAARSFFLVFRFLAGGASSVVFLVLCFLALDSAALVFLSFEATLGFTPVILVGKTMRGSSRLDASAWSTDGFFCLAAILGSMPGCPSALRFSGS